MSEVYWSGSLERAGRCPSLSTYLGGSTLGPLQPESPTDIEAQRREREAAKKRWLRRNPQVIAQKRAYDRARYERHKQAISEAGPLARECVQCRRVFVLTERGRVRHQVYCSKICCRRAYRRRQGADAGVE